jgi:hypothetical protein
MIVPWDKHRGKVFLESELLKRRAIRLGSMITGDRRRQIAVLYSLADRYGNNVFPHTFCRDMVDPVAGCITGTCCACQPDVFAFEQELLDRLPKRLANVGHYCPFFNPAKNN